MWMKMFKHLWHTSRAFKMDKTVYAYHQVPFLAFSCQSFKESNWDILVKKGMMLRRFCFQASETVYWCFAKELRWLTSFYKSVRCCNTWQIAIGCGLLLLLVVVVTNLHLTTHNHNVGHLNTNTVPACAVFWPGRAFPRAKLPLKELGSTRRP